MRPDVSVVIAAFNAEDTIASAITSVLDQQGVTFEVVVVDDASSDRTAEIARSFQSDVVKVISLADNGGPGGARNTGFAEASGRWVAVLDADDTMRPDRLARIIARAEAAQAQIVVDNLMVVQETVGHSREMFPPSLLAEYPEIRLAGFIRSNLLFKSTFNFGYMKPVFDRAFLARHRLRYDVALRIGEDYLFLASALAAGARCVVEPVAGYVYHIREGSISRVLKQGHVKAMRAADAAFEAAYDFTAEEREALAERRRSLDEAASFLSIVEHLKGRRFLKAMSAACREPGALRHMRMPIGARLRRFAGPSVALKAN